MKIYQNTSKRWLASICTVCLLSVFLSSCLKSTYNNYNPPVALVTFIQASPDEPQLDFYLNSDKVNLGPINYGDHFDYFRAYAGNRQVNFYSYATMNPVLSGN